jgi:sugar phosphate isomerase/epimerase
LFDISLAQWSLHRTIRAGDLDNLDFASYALNQFGINAVEYVNQFFKDKADNSKYIAEMVKRSKDVGVKNLLIMVDGEGELGNLNDKERIKAVENHHKWALAAKFLGCHSIRVNAAGQGSREDVSKAAVDGLGRLSEFAKSLKINVIVENHGGYSSDGQWLSGVIKEVNMPNCGTLPDFGNFKVAEGNEYDRYKGVTELMPFAKAVSAKSHDFDSAGNEIHTDYLKMMKIVTEAGYGGYVGIEYEGNELSEQQGISATMALLQKVRTDLS